VVPGYVKKII
jgi:dynein heavy chain